MNAINRTKWFQHIPSIINSITAALEKWNIDTALAKSGIPIIQGFIAVNDLLTSKKAHRKLPTLVIDELRKAYDIDIPDNANRENVESILMKAGIEQPEQAYAIILRRLTARISYPDLVDYLDSAFDEISLYLRRLITATNTKYYLRRIEEILALYPENEDEKIPRWFRSTGCIAADLNGGTVIRRNADLDKLQKCINQETVTVLVGDEASGKSVIARQLGLESQKNSDFEEIYMLEMSAYERIDGAILASEFSDIHGLVIIDDAHLNPRLVSSLYNKLKSSKILHILIVTRPSIWDALDHRYDKLSKEEIRDKAVKLDSVDIGNLIIKEFSSKRGLEDWQTEAILTYNHKSKGHLWFISYALEGALTSSGTGDVKSWIAEGVHLDLHWMERKMEGANPDFPEICVAISSIYIHEIPVAEPFLTKSLDFTVNTLNSLCQKGYILRIEKDDEIYYTLPHSSIAQAYWDSSGMYKKRLGLYNDEDAFYQYAISNVCNGLSLIMSLEQNKCNSILERMKKEDILFPMIEMEKSAAAIAKWISSGLADYLIDTDDEETANSYYRLLSSKINEADALDATLIICAIAKDSSFLHAAIEDSDAAAIAEKISALANSNDLVQTIYELIDSEDYTADILEKLNSSQIAHTLNNHDSLDELPDIVENLAIYIGSLFDDLGHEYLFKRALEETYFSDTPLAIITSFLTWILEQNESLGREFINTFYRGTEYKKLCKAVTNTEFISDAVGFINLMNDYSDDDWEWLFLLDQKALRSLMGGEGVEEGLYLLEAICDSSGVEESEIRNFIGTIGNQELRKKCEDFLDARYEE